MSALYELDNGLPATVAGPTTGGSTMAVVLKAPTSRMVHALDCEWCVAQEHNPNVTLIRHDSISDQEWFAKRESDKRYYALIGTPVPVCEWCSCPI
jgi:hypothetical protein